MDSTLFFEAYFYMEMFAYISLISFYQIKLLSDLVVWLLVKYDAFRDNIKKRRGGKTVLFSCWGSIFYSGMLKEILIAT